MPNIRWLLALITRAHRAVYLATRGRLGARILHMRFLLLYHVGRRSGLERVTPLLYVSDEDRFVVAASNAGDARHPAWWLNLRAHPEARVIARGREIAVKARAATDAERARLWKELEQSYRFYRSYRERTEREIPVVVLEPTTS